MNNWKTLQTFTYPHEAHLAQAYLQAEGQETMLRDELTVQLNNFFSNAIGGVKIMIREENYDQGITIMKKGGYINSAEYLKEPHIALLNKTENNTRCPFCQSAHFGKKQFPNSLSVIIFLILGALFPIFRTSFKCFDDEKEWKYIKTKKKDSGHKIVIT